MPYFLANTLRADTLSGTRGAKQLVVETKERILSGPIYTIIF